MQYKIQGDSLPVVVCQLEAGEKMITEGGSMAWMSPNMHMETSTGGGIGKAFGRMFSGENFFQNTYTAMGGQGLIAFASSFPGTIQAFEISPGNEMIFQKGAFLAGEGTVQVSAYVQKRASAGFLGGEGFILQKVAGYGTAFAEFDGHVVSYDLKAGQQIVISSGYLAAMQTSCQMEVRTIKGAKNVFFGGEGMFHTLITGPGRVWIQTMPLKNVADAIARYIPTSSND